MKDPARTRITAMLEISYDAECHLLSDDEAAGALKNAISSSGFKTGCCHVISRDPVPEEPDDDDCPVGG
ncbi:MAG: hypothetical protein ACOYNN_04245 [Terrimicrobiaceae bacterium]